MPQKSDIEWTATYLADGTIQKGYTSNPIYFVRKDNNKRGWFCVHASDGCRFCYAEVLNHRFGNGLDFKAQNRDKVEAVLNEKELEAIIKLNNRLKKRNETARMFCFDMTDLFGDFIDDEMRDKFFAVVALCQNITFQILTKRAKEMQVYFTSHLFSHYPLALRLADKIISMGGVDQVDFDCGTIDLPLQNLWLGVSVEDQKNADERVPYLFETPAAVRFLSVEPLLEKVYLTHIKTGHWAYGTIDALSGYLHGAEPDEWAEHKQRLWNDLPSSSEGLEKAESHIDWVIVGGESGHKARPCNINWIRQIVEQCKEASVPCFVKQLGSKPTWGTDTTYPLILKNKKGGDISEFPEYLKVREFPMS